MGQYYIVLEIENNKKLIVYNRNIIVDGKEEYMMAKLTEHSWWLNPFVNAICEKIYNNNHSRIIWMGDYADQFASELEDKHNGLTKAKIKSYHKRCWGEDDNTIAIPTTEFTLDDKYLINHTKREYINCSTYYKESEMEDEWCLHPLPLLTCIGNGLGGGDYRRPTLGSSTELVGMWAWDEISITDEPISDYTEIFPIFKEDWS